MRSASVAARDVGDDQVSISAGCGHRPRVARRQPRRGRPGTTRAPSAAKVSAVARPIPEPAPVTIATLSSSRIGWALGRCYRRDAFARGDGVMTKSHDAAGWVLETYPGIPPGVRAIQEVLSVVSNSHHLASAAIFVAVASFLAACSQPAPASSVPPAAVATAGAASQAGAATAGSASAAGIAAIATAGAASSATGATAGAASSAAGATAGGGHGALPVRRPGRPVGLRVQRPGAVWRGWRDGERGRGNGRRRGRHRGVHRGGGGLNGHRGWCHRGRRAHRRRTADRGCADAEWQAFPADCSSLPPAAQTQVAAASGQAAALAPTIAAAANSSAATLAALAAQPSAGPTNRAC